MDEKDADDDEEPEGGEGDMPPETILDEPPSQAPPPTPRGGLERFLAEPQAPDGDAEGLGAWG